MGFLNTAFFTWDSWTSYVAFSIGPLLVTMALWNSARITKRRNRLLERIELITYARRPFGVERPDGSGPLTLDDELQVIKAALTDLGTFEPGEDVDRSMLLFIRKSLFPGGKFGRKFPGAYLGRQFIVNAVKHGYWPPVPFEEKGATIETPEGDKRRAREEGK